MSVPYFIFTLSPSWGLGGGNIMMPLPLSARHFHFYLFLQDMFTEQSLLPVIYNRIHRAGRALPGLGTLKNIHPAKRSTFRHQLLPAVSTSSAHRRLQIRGHDNENSSTAWRRGETSPKGCEAGESIGRPKVYINSGKTMR